MVETKALSNSPTVFKKFFPLLKVDESTHTVTGLAADETPDLDGEIFDYDFGKKAFQQWSETMYTRTLAAGQIPSKGNVRIMHGLENFGKLVDVRYDDDARAIYATAEPATDALWEQLKNGIWSGYSVGGSYEWRKPETVDGKEYTRYGCRLAELSVVDQPCNPSAVFTYVKADGSQEMRKFVSHDTQQPIDAALIKGKEAAASFLAAIESISKTRQSNGQFTVQAQGEAHDFLTNSGYNHTRTGSSNSNDGLNPQPIYVYSKDGESVSINADGSWEHDDGHARRTKGVSFGSLKNHIEACNASAGGDMLKTELENLAKALPFRFTTEQLSAMIKGEQPSFTVGEQLRIERLIKLDAEAEAEAELEEELEDEEERDLEKDTKTKRVDGEDLPASAFLIVLDPEKTETWNLPVKFSSTEATESHIRNALARFNQLKDVPEAEKDKAWKKLLSLAREHGIDVAADTKKANWNALTVGQVLDLEKLVPVSA